MGSKDLRGGPSIRSPLADTRPQLYARSDGRPGKGQYGSDGGLPGGRFEISRRWNALLLAPGVKVVVSGLAALYTLSGLRFRELPSCPQLGAIDRLE